MTLDFDNCRFCAEEDAKMKGRKGQGVDTSTSSVQALKAVANLKRFEYLVAWKT